MKKMLLAVGVFCLQNTFSQTLVTFEDLTVPGTDSAWLGSTGEGGFTSHGVSFNNTYTTSQWGDYWNGFVYSNSTDNTTAGYTNDYSAYTGIGANSSANYAVCYGGTIDFGQNRIVESMAITNTTYAALSMLNGDFVGKVFGSVNDANGNPDGTNGEDWFRVLIIGTDAQQNVTDTVIFYLADYRFPNNQDDYIVNTWQTVDLSALGNIRYINFELESSDVGQFGMNTPGYLAIDNISFGTLSLDNQNVISWEVYPNPVSTELTVKAEQGELTIFNLKGTVMMTTTVAGQSTIPTDILTAGTYLIELKTVSGIARQTIIKK